MLYPYEQIKKIKHSRPLHKHQQGVVLVVALFIVALVATMAYAMVSRLERDIRRTSLILRNTQAEFYAQGSIAWAMDQLRNDWERQKNNKVIDAIPIESPENEVNGYKIKSIIYDMQARFNLNNLSDKKAYADFKRLLQSIEPTLSSEKADEMIRNIVEWISPDVKMDHGSNFYLDLKIPYRAAHRPMQSMSELRLVKGMTPALFNALQPYIIALPEKTLINVQTANFRVLVSLSETMTVDAAKAIEVIRSQTPILSIEAFMNLDVVKNHPVSDQKITVSSQYFLVETIVNIENQHLVLYTLLKRLTNEGKVGLDILWQSKGIW